MNTTLNLIRAANPCTSGWTKLLAGLGKTEPDDAPLPLASILQINGIDDAIWALRTCPDAGDKVEEFVSRCARRAGKYPGHAAPRAVAATYAAYAAYYAAYAADYAADAAADADYAAEERAAQAADYAELFGSDM